MFKFKPSLLVLLSLAAMAIGADDTDDKYFKEIPCPSGTKTPYYEVEVNEGFFVSLTRSDYSVSGGTEAGGKPFTFKLFDTGHEESVDMDVFWGGSPTAEKDKGIRQLICTIKRPKDQGESQAPKCEKYYVGALGRQTLQKGSMFCTTPSRG